MRKTALLTALCMILALLIAVPVSAAPGKDESIYAVLDYDGSVRAIEAVGRFTGIAPGEAFTDYGAFDSLQNLTTRDRPTVQGDRITWDLGDDPPAEFHCRGTLQKELPYTFAIRYLLDGQAVTGDTLGGKTGKLVMEMDIAPNPLCPADLREDLMVQASLSLDSGKCYNIRADGSTLVVMGGYINLAYTVLPGNEASYTLSMDAADFTMQGITFNLIPYANILPAEFEEDIDALTEGFDTMTDSMEEMIDGTGKLRDGLSDVADALGEMDTGLADLNEGAVAFASGLEDFDGGISSLRRGLGELSSGSGQIQSGLRAIDANGAPLIQGYTSACQWLDALKTQNDALIDAGLVAYLNSFGDPALSGIAQYLSQENTALADILTGMAGLNAGLGQYTGGVSALAGRYDAFHSGIASLPGQIRTMGTGFGDLRDGFADIQAGIGDLSGGMHTMYSEAAGLPADVQELIDGQAEFRDGIIEARDEARENIDRFFPGDTASPVSFVDGRNAVNSVQYMLRTPDIAEDDDPAPDLEGNGEKKGFFQRFLALFR